MTGNDDQRPEETTDEVPGKEGTVVDEGTTGELLQDKMATESILRSDVASESSNPNDQPGFQDGLLGGSDFEDRQGTPNNDGDSDLEGDARGGAGAARSGGVDGGPARTTPLPGAKK
ncbi:hypothetical protein [Deinococcus koreensis]|uniref:Uncharacterized protein n=1 Tax=Deinococcus koreensis TaxID=2054903 RepID=A0A2K3UWZ9_9DEIO|nr:hypothetical protein [Deinococcus koreensis]PNY81063.1 hypothetical protein CVO96_06435 [Deinococcus koreensis]